MMRNLLAALTALVACNALPGMGTSSDPCKTYFEEAEACAAKKEGVAADVLRKTATETKKNLEQNGNPLAVSKTCEVLLETLRKDPACARAEGSAEKK